VINKSKTSTLTILYKKISHIFYRDVWKLVSSAQIKNKLFDIIVEVPRK